MFDIFVLALLALAAFWAFKNWATVKSWFAKTESGATPAPSDPPVASSDDNSAPPGNAPPAA